MEINKRFLQFIAALQILVFHLWVPVTNTPIEQFSIKTGYLGVDIFFFLSAYSLADKKIDYSSFLKNRAAVLYLKYVFFIGLMAVSHKSFGLEKIWKSLTFYELFEKGGGAFLWFIPAILIFYVLYPLFLKWEFRWKVLPVALLWIAASVVLERAFSYTAIFIFTNRIPVILAGYVFRTRTIPRWLFVIFFPAGIALLYFFGFYNKLHYPIRDFFYVLMVPMIISFVILSTYVRESRLWDGLGAATLELYALQMIFGHKLVWNIYSVLKNPLLTNIVVFFVIFALAHWFKNMFTRLLSIKKKIVSSS